MNNKHHPFSPSRLEQQRLCPGSYVMQIGLEEVENEYNTEGHLLHERVASGNFQGLNDAQVSTVQGCLDFLATLLREGDQVFYEIHLTIMDGVGTLLTEGTADVVILHADGRLTIIDWKFGWIPVKAANENIQLATYAVGAMQKYNKTSCTVYVYQPRIRNVSNYTFQHPEAIIMNIENIINKARQQAIVLNAGQSQCRYCLARLSCPAFRVNFQKLAASRGDYDLSNSKHLEELYEVSKAAKDFIKEIEECLKKYISDNGRCGKYIIETKEGSRKLGDASMVYDRVKEWLTPKEFNSVCNIGIGKFETICCDKIIAEYKVKGEKITKDEAKKRLMVIIGDLITRDNPTKSITVEGAA